MAKLCEWLQFLCPEGKYNKQFQADFDQYKGYLWQEWDKGLLYGEKISNARTFQRRAKTFLKEDWKGLVSRKFGVKNAQKANKVVEDLILSMATSCFEYLPKIPKLLAMYQDFRLGKVSFINQETAEFISGFAYPELGHTTVYNLLHKNHLNKLVLEQRFASKLEFRSKHLPYIPRKQPSFSLSKLTMDDKSIRLSFHTEKRDKKGNVEFGSEGNPKMVAKDFLSYLVFDVYSGALIGYSSIQEDKGFLRVLKGTATDKAGKKSVRLVKDAVVNTLSNLHHLGIKATPLELEGEQHLVSSLKNDVMKPGVVFPYTRYCEGRNPQEKKAEAFIKKFKYGVEMYYEGFKARPFLKLLQNRLNTDKKQPKYTIEQGRKMLEEMVVAYNNLPHHVYKTKTIWQVFKEGLQLEKLPKPKYPEIAKHLGKKAKTTKFYRNQYVQADAKVYDFGGYDWLSNYKKDVKVEVYTLDYLPTKCWMWQNDTFLCELDLRVAEELPSASQAEKTGKDAEYFEKQVKRRAKFEKVVSERVEDLASLSPSRGGKQEDFYPSLLEGLGEVSKDLEQIKEKELEALLVESVEPSELQEEKVLVPDELEDWNQVAEKPVEQEKTIQEMIAERRKIMKRL